MAGGKGLSRSGFWSELEQLERVASVKGARFEADTPAKQLRRKAEAVVFPEKFNLHYLPHYFRDAPPAFQVLLYLALAWEHHFVARVPRGFSKSTIGTFAYTLHQVVCAPILRVWKEGTLAEVDPALDAEIRLVMAEEARRRIAVGPLSSRDLGLPDHWDPSVTAELDVWLMRVFVAQLAAGLEQPLHWDPFIQIIAVDIDLAVEFTAAIRKELEQNQLIRSDWGDLTPCKSGDWGRTIRRAASDEDWESNGTRVAAYSMQEEIRGGKHGEWRPTLAFFDDPDGEKTSRTLNQRDANEDMIDRAVENGLEPKIGRVAIWGTPHHPDCVVARKSEREESKQGWVSIRLRARDEDGRLLFPSRFGHEELDAKYARLGEKADSELGDRPPRLGNRPFSRIHYYSRAVWDGVRLPKLLMADPSYGKSDTSDFQAAVVLRGPTPEPKPRYLIHRCELWRLPDPLEYAAALDRLYQEEQPDFAAIEAIALGHLIQMLAMAAGRTSFSFASWLRIESHSESKDLRVRGIAPLINGGEIPFPDDKSCRQGELQFLNWGESRSKKDFPDVVQMGIVLMRRYTRPAGAGAGVQARHQEREDRTGVFGRRRRR